MEYGTTQDWNTDPGDVDNLMRHVRSAVGLWYGWKQMGLKEVVALYKSKKECKESENNCHQETQKNCYNPCAN